MYLLYLSAQNFPLSAKGLIFPNWSTEFDKLSLFRVPQSFYNKFSSLTKFMRFAAEQRGLSDS